ncbi:MAG TPA: cytochrome c oxidase subunit II [Planctomycetes bacterium]|nr:cytochrome c oxidase subunit II [Planctomycetota bacterium]
MAQLKHLLFRLIVTALFLAVPILGVWTFVNADQMHVWFPEAVSSFGGEIDHLFSLILWMVGITFVATEVLLVLIILRYSRRDPSRSHYTHGSHVLEMVWTAVPALLLLFILFSQMGVWSEVKIAPPHEPSDPYSRENPLMRVYASQFDWRVRYPDEEGNFEGENVVESAYDIYVPVDTKVFFDLVSRDVLHSFYVPNFRLKQDAIPGMKVPVWFEAREVGDFDLICAELCGWGHYKMAGRVHVLPQDEYTAWLEGQREALYDNGSED